MKTIKIITLLLLLVGTLVVLTGFTNDSVDTKESEVIASKKNKHKQTISLFVTHGHCSTPFAGIAENIKVVTTKREDGGNPLEDMRISFEIDPNSFNVCAGDELTAQIKTPGLFIGENNENITFRTTDVYTMGLDWYQVNGKMSIKGVEKDVKFFVAGIRDPKDSNPSSIVLSGQLNLFDWGIDYDKIVNGKSDSVATKMLYLNMRIIMS